jgi:hypothetical protein
MSEQLEKNVAPDEPDPQAIAARKDDEPGSFLALYRSLNIDHLSMDEHLVRGSVDNGVVPASVRYGVMKRGRIEAYRGVVKSTAGDLFYFNWAPNTEFHLVKADDETKHWEASKLLKSCTLGCDIRKSSSAPLDPGETVEEATEPDETKGDEEAEKGDLGAIAAQAPVQEDQYIAQQNRLLTEQHPGSTSSALPDDENTGRDWHGEDAIARSQAATRPGDGLNPLGTNDGQQHWSALDLLKAWGKNMQRTAPRLAPIATPLESRYMSEVLGMSSDQVRKGVVLAPRHQIAFQQWKAEKLRTRLSGLEHYLRRSPNEP